MENQMLFIKSHYKEDVKKAILIGLDGVRTDCFLQARTPHIDALLPTSRYTWNAMSEFKTISGPAWTTMLTGVHMEKHGVLDNDFKSRNLNYQTLFFLAKQSNPQMKAVAFSNWRPIITKIFETGVLDRRGSGSDKKMTRKIISSIRNNEGDLYFLQLDDCDGAGHKYRYAIDSPKYLQAIEKLDKQVGKIIDVIKKRPKEEDWLIIVVSDHGGDGKSHGAPTVGCLTVPLIISHKGISGKEQIPGVEEDAPTLAEIVPTIAKHMEIPPKEWWDGFSLI